MKKSILITHLNFAAFSVLDFNRKIWLEFSQARKKISLVFV